MKTCGLDVKIVFSVLSTMAIAQKKWRFILLYPLIYFVWARSYFLQVFLALLWRISVFNWIPVWNILESIGFDLLLVNPYLITLNS